MNRHTMCARVPRLVHPPLQADGWHTPPWHTVQPERLRNYMGALPAHFPDTQVKLGYDTAAIHLLFRVEDRYVRAVAARHQDSVCGDSCVEFFFTPGPDVSCGYFNLEVNCGGTMLFHFTAGARRDRIVMSEAACRAVAIAHSLPRIVDPEIRAPVTWTVACSIPIALLRGYCRVRAPEPQAVWRANFYKCADTTSHPHWLTWAPVDYPKPNFHLPHCFGTLLFA
jgi:hypothetical protein